MDIFTTASLYKHFAFSGVIDVRMEELWQNILPLKIRIFLWLIDQNMIQRGDNLRKKTVEREQVL
jgi:hypothetical protein